MISPSPFLLLLLSLFVTLSTAQNNYDFFLLVMQYAPALCSDGTFKKCPSNLITNFTLHGLWPERSDGSYPQHCTNDKFDPSEVAPIENELDTYWLSLNGPNPSFWAHEYETHGTCAQDVLPNELSFFNTTLSLRSKYDVTPALASAGIVPSSTKSFTRNEFDTAIQNAFGFPILPACDSSGYLTGATVCISKQFDIMSCGSVTYGKCSSNTLYLIDA